MSRLKSNRQLWGKDFPVGGEWDAGATPPHMPPEQSGRWTIRREPDRFLVYFHKFDTGKDILLDTFLPTEVGELDAKSFALGACANLQTGPIEERQP